MTGSSHVKVAVATTIFTLNPWIVAFAVLGALLPDIDHKNSKISRAILVRFWIFKTLKHRGFTHSLLALIGICVSAVLCFNNAFILYGVAIGYLSHIMCDMLTVEGVQLCWPSKRRFKFGLNISTGSAFEIGFVSLYCIFSIYLTLRKYNVL